MDISTALVISATRLASEIGADILFFTEYGWNYLPIIEQSLTSCPQATKPRVVVATSNQEAFDRLRETYNPNIIKLTARLKKKEDRVEQAIAFGAKEGILKVGQKLVCLAGDGFPDNPDSIFVQEVIGIESTLTTMETNKVLSAVIGIAFELAHGGPNSSPIGTAFIIGDSDEVMKRSYELVPNPFVGHSLSVTDRKNWQTIKTYAVLDGAFVVEDNGKIVAAARYLTADAKTDIPMGLGTRHKAVAAMTAVTKSIGVTVSGENGVVRIFKSGAIEAKIDPMSRILELLTGSFT